MFSHLLLASALPVLAGHSRSATSARPHTSAILRLRGGAEAVPTPEEEWDYIILGGGAAGCILANRLSADPANRVLLLEAGADSSRDLRVRVPASLVKVLRSELDWNYETQPDDDLDHSVYLCRGKTLGGSTCANVCLYHRGTAADYRLWEESGAVGWGPNEVLPYFRMHEQYAGGVSKYHGADGSVPVEYVPYLNPLTEVFLKAAGEEGYRHNHDFNDWDAPQEGFGRYRVTQHKGARSNTADTFLKEAKGRPNLCVRTGAHVTRVLLDDTGEEGVATVGAAYVLGDEQRSARLTEGGEVILSAGAVGSPQLLMLSGIGPRDHLEEKGIPVLQELDGVGEGLQDHPAVLVSFASRQACSLSDHIRLWGSKLPNPFTLLNWFCCGKGALTTVACEQGGFFHTAATHMQPDLQVRFVPERAGSPDGMNSLEKVAAGDVPASGFTFQLLACRPKSRGRVRLADADPLSKPLLEGLYLSGPQGGTDVATLREGIKLGRKLCGAAAFDAARGDELFPGAAVQSDADIDAYVRSTIHSANALTGSCRMGSSDDPLSVLDPELRVRGVRGLRVVDASAIPLLPGGQTAAPTMMIAEKAAVSILSQRSTAHSA